MPSFASCKFDSYEQHIRAVVIGASGGIGHAFSEMLAGSSAVKKIYAISRQKIEMSSVTCLQANITDEDTLKEAARTIGDEGAVNLIIIATGILHDDVLAPEKRLRDITPEKFQRVFEVNTTGPALVMKHFLPLLPSTGKSVFAALSARVGSISDNHLGGWYAYRASKTALNMLIKTAAIEVARRYEQAAVIGLHPGTVDTMLSKPFSGNVPEEKLFTPDFAAEKMLAVINQVKPDDSGKVFAWDGTEVPC